MKLINIIIEALMGAAEYKPPWAGPALVADFYTLEMLKHGEQHIESDREDLLQAELNSAERILLPELQQHLIAFASYSIICELRHCMDSATPTTAALVQLLQTDNTCMRDSAMAWLKLKAQRSKDNPDAGSVADYHSDSPGKYYPSYRMLAAIMGLAGVPDEAMRFFRRLLIDDNVNQYATEIPRPDRDTVLDNFYEPEILIPTLQAGIKLFTDGEFIDWISGYGGEPWKLACQGVLNLMQAQSPGDIIGCADHVFDLQHNNGGVLDKNREYGAWLANMLNWKRDAQSPEEIAKFASPFIRRLCRLALHQRFGRAWNRPKLQSQALEKDFHLIMGSEFADAARDEGLTINSRTYSSLAMTMIDVYNHPDMRGMDRMALMHFYKDRLQMHYAPAGNSSTLDNFTMAKEKTFTYADWDFENYGFETILGIIMAYSSGRKQIAARQAQNPDYQPDKSV